MPTTAHPPSPNADSERGEAALVRFIMSTKLRLRVMVCPVALRPVRIWVGSMFGGLAARYIYMSATHDGAVVTCC